MLFLHVRVYSYQISHTRLLLLHPKDFLFCQYFCFYSSHVFSHSPLGVLLSPINDLGVYSKLNTFWIPNFPSVHFLFSFFCQVWHGLSFLSTNTCYEPVSWKMPWKNVNCIALYIWVVRLYFHSVLKSSIPCYLWPLSSVSFFWNLWCALNPIQWILLQIFYSFQFWNFYLVCFGSISLLGLSIYLLLCIFYFKARNIFTVGSFESFL